MRGRWAAKQVPFPMAVTIRRQRGITAETVSPHAFALCSRKESKRLSGPPSRAYL